MDWINYITVHTILEIKMSVFEVSYAERECLMEHLSIFMYKLNYKNKRRFTSRHGLKFKAVCTF